jgi:hypothetical protein
VGPLTGLRSRARIARSLPHRSGLLVLVLCEVAGIARLGAQVEDNKEEDREKGTCTKNETRHQLVMMVQGTKLGRFRIIFKLVRMKSNKWTRMSMPMCC